MKNDSHRARYIMFFFFNQILDCMLINNSTLIAKTDKGVSRKENYKSIPLTNIYAKS